MNYDLNSMKSLYGINLEGLGYSYPYFTTTTDTCIKNTCTNTENSNELKINVKKHQIKFNFNL
jgi:hypothetical protein